MTQLETVTDHQLDDVHGGLTCETKRAVALSAVSALVANRVMRGAGFMGRTLMTASGGLLGWGASPLIPVCGNSRDGLPCAFSPGSALDR
jgi:hypothetical protein